MLMRKCLTFFWSETESDCTHALAAARALYLHPQLFLHDHFSSAWVSTRALSRVFLRCYKVEMDTDNTLALDKYCEQAPRRLLINHFALLKAFCNQSKKLTQTTPGLWIIYHCGVKFEFYVLKINTVLQKWGRSDYTRDQTPITWATQMANIMWKILTSRCWAFECDSSKFGNTGPWEIISFFRTILYRKTIKSEI